MEQPPKAQGEVWRHNTRPVLLAAGALIAFAANSLLCRRALGEHAIDPVSFTVIRISSGALVLSAYAAVTRRSDERAAIRVEAHVDRGWRGALWLCSYAFCFSLAYTRLEAGTGALLLFGAVQLTMFGAALCLGERPATREWLGLVGAFLGLMYLLAPGLHAPDPLAAGGMMLAGAGWACYTMEGKRSGDAWRATTANFRRAALVALPVGLVYRPLSLWVAARKTSAALLQTSQLSPEGVLLAVVSGTVASAMGYIAWYGALRYLTATRAALLQLTVPIWTAVGAWMVLGEAVTSRLIVAGTLVLSCLAYATAGGATRIVPSRH